ncbi:outer membrane usher CS3-2 domain protein [Escherichia coli]
MKKSIIALSAIFLSTVASAAPGPTKNMSLNVTLAAQPELSVDFEPVQNLYTDSFIYKDVGILTFNTSNLSDLTIMSTRSKVDGKYSGVFTFMDSGSSYKVGTELIGDNTVKITNIQQGAQITPLNGSSELPGTFSLRMYASPTKSSSGRIPAGNYSTTVNITSNVI